MSERTTWNELKTRRPRTEDRKRAYQDAEYAHEIGTRVRAEREKRDLTQAELAERMGASQPMVARLEAGGVTPNLETLHRAADALELELIVDFRQPSTG